MEMAPIPSVPSLFLTTTEAGVARVEQLLIRLLLLVKGAASRISTYSYKCLVALDLEEDDECVLRWSETSRDMDEDSIVPSEHVLSHRGDAAVVSLLLFSSLTLKPTTLLSALIPLNDLTTVLQVLEVLEDPIVVAVVLLLLLLEEVRGFADIMRVAVASGCCCCDCCCGGGATSLDLEMEIVQTVATEEIQLVIVKIIFGISW